MGRQSKATVARLNNFQKRKKGLKATVEDVSDEGDSEFAEDNLLMHNGDDGIAFSDGSDSEGGSESEAEEVEEEIDGLKNEAAINHFNQVLFEAQAMAVKAEKEAAGEQPKHKRHYTGNSARTKRHHAQKRRHLATTGQQFISSMFVKDKGRTTEMNTEREVAEIEDASESSDEEDDDVDASLRRLFPEDDQVSSFNA
jgi:hypothetical protein